MTGLKMIARFNMGLIQTYKTIMSVNTAVLCNNLIYFLRRIPLIKNIISETLYAAYGTKDAIKVFAVILNFLSRCLVQLYTWEYSSMYHCSLPKAIISI